MLTLLVEQCPKENGRAKAALDYLEHSRYRDYETALAYLSDSSAVVKNNQGGVKAGNSKDNRINLSLSIGWFVLFLYSK